MVDFAYFIPTILTIVISCIGLSIYYIKSGIPYKDDYSEITIIDMKICQYLTEYFDKYITSTKKYCCEYANDYIDIESDISSMLECGKIHLFYDEKYCQKGSILFSKNVYYRSNGLSMNVKDFNPSSHNIKEIFYVFSVNVKIPTNANFSCVEYINKILKDVSIVKNNRSIIPKKLISYKFIKQDETFGALTAIFDNKIIDSNYMGDFYHTRKEYLIGEINKFTYDCICSDSKKQMQLGFLLHGPPGSGKSDFIYRIALMLKRNIVQIDLSDISLYNLYRIIYNNDGYAYSFKNTIFTFDEIDSAIVKIHERENENFQKK